jgi:hypothetical protein
MSENGRCVICQANLSVSEGLEIHFRLCVDLAILPPLKMAERNLGTEMATDMVANRSGEMAQRSK